jgi:CheY-like chemotaxis protein
VLLIEDDRTLREDIAAFLEDRGYTALPVEDVSGAIDLLLVGDMPRPCLVLADLITLVVDWPRLIDTLHHDDQLATLPMALISVKRLGGEPHRIKRPIDFDLLDRIVKEHCCGSEGDGGRSRGRDSIGGGQG